MAGLRGRVAGAVLIGALVTGCTDTGTDSGTQADADKAEEVAFQAEAFGGTADDFYTPPDPLPDAEHGTLLRYEQLDTAIEGGTAWKVMYLSESLEGDPIAVTGVVVTPDGEPPADGWKLLSVAHGTTGIGDDYAIANQNTQTIDSLIFGDHL